MNIGAVLEGRIGTFVIPGCIERLLFARQSARFPMVEHATEFGAFVLRRGDRVRRLVGDRMWTTAETLDRAGDH